MGRDDSNIVKFIPRSRYVYFTYGVCDTFRDQPQLKVAARKLEQLGYGDLGQLLQCTEEELLTLPFMNRQLLQQMNEQLNQVGLHFGMQIPTWARPPSFER